MRIETSNLSKPDFEGQEKLDLVGELKKNPIELWEQKPKIFDQELEDKYPGKKVFAVDFAVRKGKEGEKERYLSEGTENVGGYEDGNITNIDHHIPEPRMERQVSSTNLAIEYVKEYGVIDKNSVVIINHVDCDSVLASAILRGILLPEERFGQAAIATDHTGEPSEIGDLLQAIDSAGRRDLEFSLWNLQLLLNDQPLEIEAQKMLDKRHDDRQRAEKVAKRGFHLQGKVAWIELEEKIDGGLLPPFLPKAEVIMLCSPMENDPTRWEIKIRLGKSAPEGLVLNKLGIPEFGGRWNAGSNKRHGGTSKSPEEVAKIIDGLIGEKFS